LDQLLYGVNSSLLLERTSKFWRPLPSPPTTREPLCHLTLYNMTFRNRFLKIEAVSLLTDKPYRLQSHYTKFIRFPLEVPKPSTTTYLVCIRSRVSLPEWTSCTLHLDAFHGKPDITEFD